MLRKAFFIGFVLMASTWPAHAAEPRPWTEISDTDGIQIWQRPVEGTPFVAFRGRMIMNGSVKKLIAILHDQKNKTQWMHNCVDNRILERRGIGNTIIYNRTGIDVIFVSDRDVVVETKLTVLEEENRVRVDAWSVTHPDMPEVSGVVRLPNLSLRWDFKVLTPKLTEVTYQVQTDPGGWVPAWLVNRVSRKIPYYSLRNLSQQVTKPYLESMEYVDSRVNWAGLGL